MRVRFFVLRLTRQTAARGRLHFETTKIDFAAAFLAIAVVAFINAAQGSVDFLQLFHVPTGFLQTEIGNLSHYRFVARVADDAHRVVVTFRRRTLALRPDLLGEY